MNPVPFPDTTCDNQAIAAGVDTFVGTVEGELPAELGADLDGRKVESQQAEEDLPTPLHFTGEVLFIKPHGAQRHWCWILHCPSLHLELGRGKFNRAIARARLSAAFLWGHGFDVAVMVLYTFLYDLLGHDFKLHVSELHACVDVAGWELTLGDAGRFITRGHNVAPRVVGEEDAEAEETEEEAGHEHAPDGFRFVYPALVPRLQGRCCRGYDFSRGAAHACCIYDKTAEIVVSRKDWMRAVWGANGWDGASRVTRVEFRYKRDCLRELGVDDAEVFLERRRLEQLWAYSTKSWLRHANPTQDSNKARWPVSPVWRLVQQAALFGDGTPGVRERKTAGDLKLICQMMAGCSSTAGALLTGTLPTWDDGANFLGWFYTWLGEYLSDKGTTFEAWCSEKRLRLGVVMPIDHPAA